MLGFLLLWEAFGVLVYGLWMVVYNAEGNEQPITQNQVHYVTASTNGWYKLSLLEITLTQNGFVKIFVASESDVDV
ncbi:hypothetical protein AAG747_19200 [Rapidithrix thailandica]|uniref:Uncharacterized protein n=1 Tax=Rapidithrix thailandica TaxID=413964 RepID=A0AAW9S856_9BACT